MIGIVVPVYNAQAYLRRCVDSILSQSWNSFLLVLVDDESPDECGQICEMYAQKDSRVKVIHQKNAGVAAARNSGMEYVFAKSQCQWLAFVDSDDWVDPQYLNTLYTAVSQTGCTLSACGFYHTNGEMKIPTEEFPIQVLDAKTYFCRAIHEELTFGPCNKLYHRSLLLNLRFPVGRCVEDEFVVYRAIFEAETLAVTMAPLYAYYCHPKSFTRCTWSPKRLDAWDAYEEQLTFFTELGDSELIHYRYRGYLENVKINWSAAQETLPPGTPLLRQMKQRIRYLIKRAWLGGHMDFWIDFDILYEFYPFLTRLYRLWLEIRQKWRKYSG